MRLNANLQDVKSFISLCEENNIEFCLDGGWGVDALIGHQTRPHEDIDVAVNRDHAAKLKDILLTDGYHENIRHDSGPLNYVLQDDEGHQIEVCTYFKDAKGYHVFSETEVFDNLISEGFIDGKKVKCISAECQLKFHTGYEIDEQDYLDMKLISEKFNLTLPAEYDRFKNKEQGSRP
jgi:lincosamide nucleotidyltransferase A/C/D/E